MKVIIVSRYFPKKHPRAGQETLFMEKIWKGLDTGNHRDGEYTIYSKYPRLMKDGHWQIPVMWRDLMNAKRFKPKYHTLRAGHRWNAGEMASLRVWSGAPYRSKQIEIAQVELKQIWGIKIDIIGNITIKQGKKSFMTHVYAKGFTDLATNDGLNRQDLIDWLKCHPKRKKGKYLFDGQIVCWSDLIRY